MQGEDGLRCDRRAGRMGCLVSPTFAYMPFSWENRRKSPVVVDMDNDKKPAKLAEVIEMQGEECPIWYARRARGHTFLVNHEDLGTFEFMDKLKCNLKEFLDSFPLYPGED